MAKPDEHTMRVLLLLMEKGELPRELVVELLLDSPMQVEVLYDIARDEYKFNLRYKADSWGTLHGTAALKATWALIRTKYLYDKTLARPGSW